jgi:hypothetical protein
MSLHGIPKFDFTALALLALFLILCLGEVYRAQIRELFTILPPLAVARIDRQSIHSLQQTKPEKRILIYITTHLSETHSFLLERCWPSLLSKSPLFKQADFMMYVTESEDRKVNMTVVDSVFANTGVTLLVRPNPGYNEGAVLAITEAFQEHWFDAYEWVIRLNADVLIRNDTFLLEQFKDKSAQGIFDDCLDVECPEEKNCQGRLIHTDFFAVRPDALPANAFLEAQEREENAERMATDAFASIVDAGTDRWLPGTGPHGGLCRVIGASSPVLHTHEIEAVYPACLSWYS